MSVTMITHSSSDPRLRWVGDRLTLEMTGVICGTLYVPFQSFPCYHHDYDTNDEVSMCKMKSPRYVELALLMDQSTGGNWARLNEADSDTTALANTIKEWKGWHGYFMEFQQAPGL